MTPPLIVKRIAALAELRIAVLEANTRRSPKWGFRLAPDLVMQLQAKPVLWADPRMRRYDGRQEQVRFVGIAEHAVGGVVPSDVFRTSDWRDPHMRQDFTLIGYEDTPDRWELRSFGGRWSLSVSATSDALKQTVLERLYEAFTNGTFDRFSPELMLRPACLRCGKALTDPASMARWIGPECAHTGSLNVPGLVRVDETQESLLAK